MPVADHIDNAVRSVTFNPVASAGPFALPFPIYEADSAAELKSDFLITLAGVVQTNFTVAGTFVDSVALDGAVTFGSAITGELIIYSRRKPRTSVDVSNGQAVTSEELRAIINGLLASERDIYDWLARVEAGTVLPAGFFVDKAGDTMTGFLTLNADPVNVLHAAPKQYVDGKLPITTKGDLTSWSTLPVRVPVGSDGKRLVADSSATPGIAWSRDIGELQSLTDGANIAWNMDLSDNAQVTLGGNRTLDAPSNAILGQFGFLEVNQDATGNRTLAWNAAYKFPNNADEKPDRAASSLTRYIYGVRAADNIIVKKLWTSSSNSIGFYKEYTLQNPYAVGTVLTQAHGLGRYPAAMQCWIECLTTDQGWAVGDRIDMNSLIDGASGSLRPSLGMNATNIFVVTGDSLPLINNFSTTAQAAIVAANWKTMARVYE